jgi:hypothetical protein
MQCNENGWPIAPERGKYIGEVDDIYYAKVNMNGRYYEPNAWAARRVYKDEITMLNNMYSKENLIEAINKMEELRK